MLTGLRLENIALIDALDLSFRPGFTVLTGETGAGKSLLLDALDALLGGAQGLRACGCCDLAASERASKPVSPALSRCGPG